MEMEGSGEEQSIIRTFEDLDVWKVRRDLRTQIAIIVRTFLKEEQYRLRDQLIRASRSVTANLTEGYGRFHYAEHMQFARQARGSLYEIIVTTQVDRRKTTAFSLNP
jgi:four helix bundle protein